MEHEVYFVELINELLGPLFAALLGLFGIEVADPHRAMPGFFAMSLVVSLILIVLALIIRRGLSVENPTKLQHLMESYIEALRGLMEQIIAGHFDWRRYMPFLATLGLFILFGNLLGLVPGFMSPTSSYHVTVSLAILAFLYYQWQGIARHGLVAYLKHFAGPIWWLAPLMIPIELLSHLARPFSLSIRLFANIFGEDMIIVVFALLFPLLLPLPIMVLAVFTSVLQAFVFVLLTIIYISGAVAEESH